MTPETGEVLERLSAHEISRHHGGCADCYGITMDDAAEVIRALVAEHDARVTELLQANNEYLERARAAEREVLRLRDRLAKLAGLTE